jgi:uncharacterized protein (DUF58 family)
MTVVFLLALILVAALLQRRSGQQALERLKAEQRVSQSLLEPDEQFELTLSFENGGWFLIPFLRYSERLFDEVVTLSDNGVTTGSLETRHLAGTSWLMPHQRLEKHFPMSVPKRGRYMFGDLVVFGGDFLGTSEDGLSFGGGREIVVYPRRITTPDLDGVFGGFLGEMSVRRFIQEDPVLTLGYREYTGREPMKTISWAQSARRGELMVKKFDYTLEPSVSVILNIEAESDIPLELEKCFSLARSVCALLEDKGIKYDFRMNAVALGGVSPADYIAEGLGSSHYSGILEGLGRASYTVREGCSAMLEKALQSSNTAQGIVFITPGDTPIHERNARRLAERTGGVLLVLSAKEVPDC